LPPRRSPGAHQGRGRRRRRGKRRNQAYLPVRILSQVWIILLERRKKSRRKGGKARDLTNFGEDEDSDIDYESEVQKVVVVLSAQDKDGLWDEATDKATVAISDYVAACTLMREEFIAAGKDGLQSLKKYTPYFSDDDMKAMYNVFSINEDTKDKCKLLLNLVNLDVGKFMAFMLEDHHDVVLLALSAGGAPMSEGFSERGFSASNLVMTKLRVKLGHLILKMLTVMRVNKGFRRTEREKREKGKPKGKPKAKKKS
jgi:hypothetical protein